MEQEYREDDDSQIGSSLDFEIPDAKSVLSGLGETIDERQKIRREHDEANEKDNKKGKKKARKQKRGGEICCCGNPHCGIGPMMPTEE